MVPVRSGEAELGVDGECSAAAAERGGASRSHSEAERKRRGRINAHLDTLRGIVPSASRVRDPSSSMTMSASCRWQRSTRRFDIFLLWRRGVGEQMDKAALLGEVVRYVRDLRGEAGGAAAGAVVPGEGDEVGVQEEEEEEEEGCSWDGGERTRRVSAWVCCADRPGLMSELARAVRSVSARAVRAEIATVGGRTRSVLQLDIAGGDDGASASRPAPALEAALRAVLISREELLAVESYKRRRYSPHFTKV
ncbi:hypothetical protein GUJ93_ZPchr0002g23572 [Zizania palustris]|uniref:BHLH domain-containing protein n=1 Tax=Zizania palustris TaxID=103762 RepID=A0A8J5S2Q5_ZIZPA|nr:hypothetical protein GUJ93_ZPchr0002g23572 [Zizania palustris]